MGSTVAGTPVMTGAAMSARGSRRVGRRRNPPKAVQSSQNCIDIIAGVPSRPGLGRPDTKDYLVRVGNTETIVGVRTANLLVAAATMAIAISMSITISSIS